MDNITNSKQPELTDKVGEQPELTDKVGEQPELCTNKKLHAKDVSLWAKLLIIVVCAVMCVLLGLGIINNITVDDIWKSGVWAYVIACGTIDVNIMLEKFTGGKK